MESIREIIGNLDIYKNKNSENILYNNYYINYDSKVPKAWTNDTVTLPVNTKQKTTKIIPKSTYQTKEKKKQINYNQNFLYNPQIDFVTKNKESIKEKEYKIKEDKLRKENEALKLLLNSKKPNHYSYISSRVYNIKNPKNSNLQKYNLRSISSQNKVKAHNIKYVGGLYNSVDLPRIQSSHPSPLRKENSNASSTLNLHKEFGKTPEYLEKMKEEYKEQKEYEKIREKEKKLPKGTRFLPENERLERLSELANEEKALENELFALALTRLTQKMINRNAEIEKRLFEIETEMRRLSYKNVVIHE